MRSAAALNVSAISCEAGLMILSVCERAVDCKVGGRSMMRRRG